MKVVIVEEQSVESSEICHELRERARAAARGSSAAVNQLEWKAASLIEALVRRVSLVPDRTYSGERHIVTAPDASAARTSNLQPIEIS